MNTFTYIIIDDEPKAIRLLEKKITLHYDNMHQLGAYTSADEAKDVLKAGAFDLLFLDISMPYKTGFSILEDFADLDAEVIFVTAHEEYALKAFGFTPAGYVLKPIVDSKLQDAVNNALQRVAYKKKASAVLNEPPKTDKIQHPDKIGIRNNKGIDYVALDDILFMEATSRYTKVVTKEKVYLSSYNIGKLKQLVEAGPFYQVHRSFLVNLRKIRRYETHGVVIIEDGHELPVAKNLRDDFLRLFENM